MTRGSKSLTRPAIKLALFCGAGVLAAVVVANTLTVPVNGRTVRYSALFSDVDGLTPGNDVTLAGVRVGRVDSVSFTGAAEGRAQAVVGIEVLSDKRLPGDVGAAVRYADMLGVRSLALTTPPGGGSGTLTAGAQIPLNHTTPPVDLTALVNGFKPLFDAIDPAQINDLAHAVVGAFQGESGTISTLLLRIADVTANLNDHEALFSQLVTNLNALLGAVDQRGSEVNELITGLADMSSTIAGHNQQLITLLDDGSSTVHTVVSLMNGGLAPLNQSLTDVKNMTTAWIPNTAGFNVTMAQLPRLAASLNRMGDYGSWLNLYTCNFTVKAGDVEVNAFGAAHSEVCR
jgi:phospholipid/cholesterol/gamma-HCH transport system substrate-binding protein